MVLGTLAEHSIPFSKAPVIVKLAQTLSLDKPALQGMKLSRTAASYKMIHGLEKVLCEFFEKNNIPWNNLVSMLMDSCAVMRGSKTGLEIRMHQYCPNLLDVDGDSCHHIHSTAKKFSEPFDSYLEKLFSDLQVDHQWSPDQVNKMQL
ncbi:hypothetical protein CgunFtcFv8_003771 [Champsocephalus gunnari]|uniref:Uncharacterized protein n=1 Tax=Champsocephalus gunnari TaxID=52237 RepID=A0AAN8E1H7_CHAGU|nr:hypothetical protein CgunFtcFv8_003771 [Champsocephalus gunnari]